jgi:hypothetical protein
LDGRGIVEAHLDELGRRGLESVVLLVQGGRLEPGID